MLLRHLLLHVTHRKQLEFELLPDIRRTVKALSHYRDDRLSHLQSPSTLKVAASLHVSLLCSFSCQSLVVYE